MKKSKLLAVLAITTLNLGAIASCGGARRDTITPEEIVKAVLDDSSIIATNDSTPIRPTTYPGAYNEIKLGTGSYIKITDKYTYLSDADFTYDVNLTWTYDETKWTTIPQDAYKELRPKSTVGFNETDEDTIKVTASYGDATAIAEYKVLRVNDKNLVKIKDMPKTGPVAVQGYVTGIISNLDENGKASPYGLYVQDGEYAMMAYKPNWNEIKNIKIGDVVEVLGTGSDYNGVKQVEKPTVFKITEEMLQEGVEKATITELSEISDLSKVRGRTIKMSGAKVLEVTKVKEGNHENGILNAKVRYQGKDIWIVSDKYNTDYAAKDKAYDLLKSALDSNGAKTLTYTAPIASVYAGNPASSSDRVYVDGFTFTGVENIEIKDEAYAPVKGINASADKTILRVNETAQISAELIDIEEPGITYESLTKDIATVDANGKVTAIKDGKAKIKVSSTADNTVSKEITIDVAKKVTIAEAYNLKSNTVVEVTGVYQDEFIGNQGNGLFIDDGEKSLYLYKPASKDIEGLAVGKHVNTVGKIDIYNGLLQLKPVDTKVVETSTATKGTRKELTSTAGVTGQDASKAVTVKGKVSDYAFKAHDTDSNKDAVEFKVTLADNTKALVRADKRYTRKTHYEAILGLKDGDDVTIHGNIAFYNSKSKDENGTPIVNKDATGLQILNARVDGVSDVELEKVTKLSSETMYSDLTDDDKSYAAHDGDHLVNGTYFTTLNVMRDTWHNMGQERTVLQFKKSDSYLKSKTALKVSKVTIVYTSTKSSFDTPLAIKVGDTALTHPDNATVSETAEEVEYNKAGTLTKYYNYKVVIELPEVLEGTINIAPGAAKTTYCEYIAIE